MKPISIILALILCVSLVSSSQLKKADACGTSGDTTCVACQTCCKNGSVGKCVGTASACPTNYNVRAWTQGAATQPYAKVPTVAPGGQAATGCSS